MAAARLSQLLVAVCTAPGAAFSYIAAITRSLIKFGRNYMPRLPTPRQREQGLTGVRGWCALSFGMRESVGKWAGGVLIPVFRARDMIDV